jgi:NAD(P)-dependent dehydrogenase (short-subunit alcohol dehydrogenase family)
VKGVRQSPIEFHGRVAVVTDGGRGLGRTYALELAARGALVVVNDVVRTADGESSAEALARVITSQGGTATAHQDSIADPGAAESLIRQAVDRHGWIDILVNNAGFSALTDMESHPSR